MDLKIKEIYVKKHGIHFIFSELEIRLLLHGRRTGSNRIGTEPVGQKGPEMRDIFQGNFPR